MITESELIEARESCFSLLHGVAEVFYRLVPVKGRCIKSGDWEPCCDLMTELYGQMLDLTSQCETSLPKALEWIKRTNSIKDRHIVNAGDIPATTYHELAWKLGLRVERILAMAEQSFEDCDWTQPEELGWIANYTEDAQKLIPCVDQEATDSLVRLEQAEPQKPSNRKTSPLKSVRAVEALLGDDSKEILDIARGKGSVDKKMREICGVDRRFLGWDSRQWAELLGVKSPAIRKTKFWKEDRPKAIEAQRYLDGE